MDEWVKGWLASEATDRDKIVVKRVYIDINDGNLTDGILFSQIMYWHGINQETGKPRLSILRDGHLWLAKHFRDWWAECRIDERTAKRAMARLEQRGLIETQVWKYGDNRITHIRVLWEQFKELVFKVTNVSDKGTDLSAKVTKGNVAKGQIVPLQRDKVVVSSYTEITTETPTENTTQNTENTLRASRADARPAVIQEPTPPASRATPVQEKADIPEAAKPPAVESPKPAAAKTEAKKPNLYEFAVGFAWANAGLGKAMLGQLLGTAKKGERADYKLDPPATPEEIMGWHFWHKHKYGAEEWKKFLPRAAEKVKLSWEEFRGDTRWYQIAVDRGASELEKQFAPPEPEIVRPQLSDEERAANIARYQQLLKEFSAKHYVDFSKDSSQDKKVS